VNEPLRITLSDAANLLKTEHIPYALVGALAVSVRGQPRATSDVDMVIDADLDRALALAGALDATQFAPLFQDIADVVQRSFILPLRHRQTNVKVDLAVGLSGFEKQAVARASRMEVGGTELPVATAEDLIVMKVLAGRPRDEQDLQGLVIAQGDRLDWEYCVKTAVELGAAISQDLAVRVRALRESTD
jgi:hypothetical protein